jgi:transposase
VLGAKVIICKPADPEAKVIIERLHDYLERSFLPGRSFTSPLDFNTQLQAWLGIANRRRKRSLGCAPVDRIGADRAAMLALPPVPPVTGWEMSLRLPRDHYVRLDCNDYSVHPTAVGRRVLVRADLDRVRVWCEGGVVADHERVWARHQTISDPAHVKAAQILRQQRFTLIPPATETEVDQRSLIDYDSALGVSGFDEGMAL